VGPPRAPRVRQAHARAGARCVPVRLLAGAAGRATPGNSHPAARARVLQGAVARLTKPEPCAGRRWLGRSCPPPSLRS
jgi:hypothetical protein